MIKDVFLINSRDLPNELPAFERFYYRYHAPEVMSNRGPLLVRFVGYRPVPPIPEALDYGYYNMRVTEAWFRSVAERPSRTTNNILNYRWEREAPWVKQAPPAPGQGPRPGGQGGPPAPGQGPRIPAVNFTVDTQPTEVFLGGKWYADDKTILRWYTVTKYPTGVPIEQGEDWFLNVHSKEVLQQPGLTAYFSHRTIAYPGDPPPTWVRLTELWYENFNGWKKSVIESPPKYTKPPWAKYDKYPFLEPYVDFASTFLMERPDHDYLRETTPYP